MSLQDVVARNVRALRRQRSWSQEQLAEATKLHRTYIGAVERAERNVSLHSIAKLARGLGVPAFELLRPQRGVKQRA